MTALPLRHAARRLHALAPGLLVLALAACQPPGDGAAGAPADAHDAAMAAPAGVAPPATAAAASSPATTPETRGIHVDQPWIRATPPNARAAGGYLRLHNAGAGEDRLLSVTTDAAARVEIHEMSEADGVMRMRPLPDGVVLPAGATVALAPGGNHLMLIEPRQPFVEGGRVEATLRFTHAPEQRITFEVRALTASAGDGAHGH